MQSLAVVATIVSEVCVLLCFLFLSLKDREKPKMILVVFGLVMFVVFVLVSGPAIKEGRGEALTEFDINRTYVTEWVQVNDSTVVMKLRRDDSKKSLYYEIQKERIVLWNGGKDSFPAKFRIVTNKKYKVYALIPVK